MSRKESSRRVYPTKDTHATATDETVVSFQIGDTTNTNINRSTQVKQSAHRPAYTREEADRREREARYRIERQRERQQAARYFCQMAKGVRYRA